MSPTLLRGNHGISLTSFAACRSCIQCIVSILCHSYLQIGFTASGAVLRMGRTYSYECAKCGYRAMVAGGEAHGIELSVQSIVCKDCKQLHDVVIALRTPENAAPLTAAPSFEDIMKRLPLFLSAGPLRWEHFSLVCPVSENHDVKEWREPGRCPRCHVFMERSPHPFRQWE